LYYYFQKNIKIELNKIPTTHVSHNIENTPVDASYRYVFFR